MEITTEKNNNTTIVSIKGKLDAVTVPDFRDKLEGLISEGEDNFIFDLDNLEYISSAGIGSIIAVAKTLKTKGGQILLSNIKGMVKEVFEISGVDSVFKVFDSVEDALQQA